MVWALGIYFPLRVGDRGEIYVCVGGVGGCGKGVDVSYMTYQVEHGGGNDGIESGGAGEVEEAVDADESDGKDRAVDGKFEVGVDDGEERGEGDAVLVGDADG